MHSLTAKLMLAFLLTSVVGVALAGLLIRASVARGFDTYVIDQQRDAIAAEVASFYAATGTWPGERGGREGPPNRRPGPGGGRPAPGIPFMIADTTGTIVVGERHRLGTPATGDEVARGEPVLVNDVVVGTVLVPDRPPSYNLAEERYLGQTDRALALAGAASVGIALGLGLLLAGLITRPARELTDAAGRIAGGDLAQRVPVRSRDELGVLAAQFNHMSADLARATALRRQLTADIAHDLRTPLTVIAGYLEALRDRVLTPTPERFATLHGETQLLLRLVEDLHTLSLADAGELTLQRQPIAPRLLLERAAEAHRHAADGQGVALEVEADPSLPPLSGDPERLARVLGNLVGNALRHTPRGGRVRLAAEATPTGVRLSVADTGEGIAAEHLPNIFERSYRADAARSSATGGSGLGLAIARSLVEAHGGQIGVSSAPGRGATFTISLPRPTAEPPTDTARPAAPAPA